MTTQPDGPPSGPDLIRRRVDEVVTLLDGLTEDQLALPTRPARARASLLGETIELVLVGHLDLHRAAIEEKLRVARGTT